jgi:hypothetical protein
VGRRGPEAGHMSTAVRRALYGKMAGDTTLNALLASPPSGWSKSIYHQQAPAGQRARMVRKLSRPASKHCSTMPPSASAAPPCSTCAASPTSNTRKSPTASRTTTPAPCTGS